jgi:DNA-binding transcriptional LysR family regulator
MNGSQGLTVSDRALLLKPQVDILLAQFDKVFNEQNFKPENTVGNFRVSVSDTTMQFITQQLVIGSMQQAPHLVIELMDRRADAWGLLESGRLDLFLGYKDKQPALIQCEKIFKESYLLMVANVHSLATQEKLTLNDTLIYPMVNNANSQIEKLIDTKLKEAKLSRKIQLSSESLFCLKQAVETGLLIGFFPKSFIDAFADLNKVKVFDIEGMPHTEGYMYWHKKSNNEPINEWMRQQFRNIANSPELHIIN